MLWAVVPIVFAVACVGGSVWVIRKYDHTRLWDHYARSLVQIAIATITVLVAFSLFRAQLGEQDSRLRMQQARSAAAALRFIMVMEGEVPKDATALFPSVSSLDCEVKAECDAHDKDLFVTQKARLAAIYNEPQKLLLGRPNVRDDILQLVRGNYIFADGLVDLSLYAAEQYERGFADVMDAVDKLRGEFNKAEAAHPNSEIPLSDMAVLYEKFAREQARSAQIAVTFICRLNKINQLLLGGMEPAPQPPTRDPTIDVGITCPPYDAPFAGILNWYENRKQ